MTLLLLPGIAPLLPPVPEAGMQAGLMIAAEVITGLWLGWLARLLVLALPIAGQFIAYMLGLANVLQPDPQLGGQATPIARLFALAAPLAILISGLYALPLAALAGSYGLIPPGTLLPAADTAQTAVRAVGARIRAVGPAGLALPARRHRLARRRRPAGAAGAPAAGLLRRHAGADPRRHRAAGDRRRTRCCHAWQDAVRSGFAGLPGP